MTTATLEEKWLECRIDKGMFSDELAVTYPTGDEWVKSVFVPYDMVRGKPGEIGKVRVAVVRQDGRILATLPNARRDIVEVQPEDITE